MSLRTVFSLAAALTVMSVSGRVTPSSEDLQNPTADYRVVLSSDDSDNYTSDYLGTLSRRSRRGAVNTDILRQHLKQVKLGSVETNRISDCNLCSFVRTCLPSVSFVWFRLTFFFSYVTFVE